MNFITPKTTCLLFVLLTSLNAFSAPVGESFTTNKQTLLLTISYENSAFHIDDAQVINGVFASTPEGDRLANTLTYKIANGQGGTVYNGTLIDPKILRGVLDEQGTEGHEYLSQQQTTFMIRLPYHREMEALILSYQKAGPSSRSISNSKSQAISFKHLIQ